MATPAKYTNCKRVLQEMEEETQDVIKKDEEKLKKEAQKITHLLNKIDKEERIYQDVKRELCEAEEIEAELEAKQLKKAEERLTKITEGKDKSPVREKIEEVFHDAKHFSKEALSNVANFAHLRFADDKESKARETTLERGDDVAKDTFPTGKGYDVENNIKTEKKLRAAAQHIDHLRKELAEKQKSMIEEDVELLRIEAQKIQRLQQQLEEEQQKYNGIAAELSKELQQEAQIREEELKLKEFELAEERSSN